MGVGWDRATKMLISNPVSYSFPFVAIATVLIVLIMCVGETEPGIVLYILCLRICAGIYPSLALWDIYIFVACIKYWSCISLSLAEITKCLSRYYSKQFERIPSLFAYSFKSRQNCSIFFVCLCVYMVSKDHFVIYHVMLRNQILYVFVSILRNPKDNWAMFDVFLELIESKSLCYASDL